VECDAAGVGRVVVPRTLPPYDASAVSFDDSVALTTEEGTHALSVYGAGGPSPAAAFSAAIDATQYRGGFPRKVVSDADNAFELSTDLTKTISRPLHITGPIQTNGATLSLESQQTNRTLAAAVTRGDTTIPLNDLSGIDPKDNIHLSSDESATDSPHQRDASFATLVEAVDATNDEVTLAHKLYWDFDPANYTVDVTTAVRPAIDLSGLTLYITGASTFASGMNISQCEVEADPLTIVDRQDRGQSGISLFQCVGASVQNLTTVDCVYGLWLRTCTDCSVSGVRGVNTRHAVVNGALTLYTVVSDFNSVQCSSVVDCHASFECEVKNGKSTNGFSPFRGMGTHVSNVTIEKHSGGDGTPDINGYKLGPNYSFYDEIHQKWSNVQVWAADEASLFTLSLKRGHLHGSNVVLGKGVAIRTFDEPFSFQFNNSVLESGIQNLRCRNVQINNSKIKNEWDIGPRVNHLEVSNTVISNVPAISQSDDYGGTGRKFLNCTFLNIDDWATGGDNNSKFRYHFVGCQFGQKGNNPKDGIRNTPQGDFLKYSKFRANTYFNSYVPTLDNGGTTTLGSGNTSTTVSHGLDRAPSIEDVQVTPATTLGAATSFWVTNLGSGSFDIKVDADPTQDIEFNWKVDARIN